MMNSESSRNFEKVCALVDGQLRGKDFAETVDFLHADREARSTWHAYHVVGDVLRSTELPQHGLDDIGFLARFQVRLAREEGALTVPAVPLLEAMSAKVERHGPEAAAVRVHGSTVSANEPAFRWKMFAGFASVAAVAALGWNVMGGMDGLPGRSAAQQLAAAPAGQIAAKPVLAASGAGVMIRDPHLDELLAAHRQFGGASALQTPTGFLRNATFDGTGR